MGRYEVLLQKTMERVLKSFSNWNREDVVSENPTEFLEKLFRKRFLTKDEINNNLIDYYGKYSEKSKLNFIFNMDEEGEKFEIEPGNDYTAQIMQKVRNIFKGWIH